MEAVYAAIWRDGYTDKYAFITAETSFVTCQPRLSVLLPCRDAEDTLGATLESLQAQEFEEFEIVAVDDGSTDGTGAQLAEWAQREHRLRVLHTPPDGIVAALNKAAKVARGDIFVRMDADDVAHPARLDRQFALLRDRPEIAACGTWIRYFPRSIVREGARRYEEWINSIVTHEDIDRDIFVECPLPHPTLALRRTAFEQVGGYRDNGWPEDYDLILRLWSEGMGLGKVAEYLLEWRESPTRLSRTDPRYSETAFRNCKAFFLRKRIANRNVVVCGAGPVGKAFALALHREGHVIAAFVDVDPRKIGQVIHGAPVIHPDDVLKFRGCFFVAAVGSSRGRSDIRAQLLAAGFDEPDEFCAVA